MKMLKKVLNLYKMRLKDKTIPISFELHTELKNFCDVRGYKISAWVSIQIKKCMKEEIENAQ